MHAAPNNEPFRVVRPEAGDLALSRLSQLYVRDLITRRLSEGHIATVRGNLGSILGLLGDVPCSQLDEPLMLAYRSKRIEIGRAVRTVNHETQALKRALRWAKKAGHILSNQLADFEKLTVRPRDVKKRRRALTDAEYRRFVKAARKDDAQAKTQGKRKIPQTPLFLTFLDTGGRRKEMLDVRWRHVELDLELPPGLSAEDRETLEGCGRIRFITTKSGKERSVPIAPAVAEELRALRDIQTLFLGSAPRGGEHVFLSSMGRPFTGTSAGNTLRTFYRILELAGIPREVDGKSVDLHSCRMSASTFLQRAGANLKSVQQILGHASPDLTANTYTDFGETENLAALSLRVKRELRLRGASAEDIEEALRAISLGNPFSVGVSQKNELVVNDGGLHAPTDYRTSNPTVTGSNPVGRASLPDSQPIQDVEPPPCTGVTVITTEALEAGSVLALTPALLGPDLSKVLVALAQGQTVVLIASSHRRTPGSEGTCNDERNDDGSGDQAGSR